MSEANTAHQRIALVSETRPGPFTAAISVGRHRLTADEPESAGGGDAGPDPYEFLLAGLGACTAMTIRLYASHKGWPLDHVEVRVTQTARATKGAPKDVFEREISLVGELSAEERARLLEVAERCPVSRTLAGGSTIQAQLVDVAPVGEASA